MALSLGGNIYILCDTLSKHQPFSYFDYHFYNNSYVKTPNDIPKDYIHWLHIFNDVYGNSIDVLYPKTSNKGQSIFILYRGFYQSDNEWKKISWTHGDPLLFEHQIMPLLEIEWTYPAKIKM